MNSNSIDIKTFFDDFNNKINNSENGLEIYTIDDERFELIFHCHRNCIRSIFDKLNTSKNIYNVKTISNLFENNEISYEFFYEISNEFNMIFKDSYIPFYKKIMKIKSYIEKKIKKINNERLIKEICKINKINNFEEIKFLCEDLIINNGNNFIKIVNNKKFKNREELHNKIINYQIKKQNELSDIKNIKDLRYFYIKELKNNKDIFYIPLFINIDNKYLDSIKNDCMYISSNNINYFLVKDNSKNHHYANNGSRIKVNNEIRSIPLLFKIT